LYIILQTRGFFPGGEGIQYLAFNNRCSRSHSRRGASVGCSGAARHGGVITAKRRCRLRPKLPANI